MRNPSSRNPIPGANATLLALSVAVCLGTMSGGAVLPSESASTGAITQHFRSASDRRTVADTDEAVAAFMACLHEAAKTIAGHTAAVIESQDPPFTLQSVAIPAAFTAGLSPRYADAPHLSRLNLPPPRTLA